MIRLLAVFSLTATLLAQQPTAPGRRLFEAQCALCHGQNGGGGRGPSLLKPKLIKAPDDKALAKVIEDGIAPEMPGAWQLNPKEVADVAAYVRSLGTVAPEVVPGDPAQGRAVYAKSGCSNCHIIEGIGSGFGPELSSIGLRRNAAHLRESITTPNATLPDGYLVIEAIPTTGTAVKGVRLAEDPFSVQLTDASGRLHSFRKSELRELKTFPKTSPMPAYTRLAPKELEDLVAYLASLKGLSQ